MPKQPALTPAQIANIDWFVDDYPPITTQALQKAATRAHFLKVTEEIRADYNKTRLTFIWDPVTLKSIPVPPTDPTGSQFKIKWGTTLLNPWHLEQQYKELIEECFEGYYNQDNPRKTSNTTHKPSTRIGVRTLKTISNDNYYALQTGIANTARSLNIVKFNDNQTILPIMTEVRACPKHGRTAHLQGIKTLNKTTLASPAGHAYNTNMWTTPRCLTCNPVKHTIRITAQHINIINFVAKNWANH